MDDLLLLEALIVKLDEKITAHPFICVFTIGLLVIFLWFAILI